MKTKSLNFALLLLSVFVWSCDNNELNQNSLKSSVNNSIDELTTALETITKTDGYKVMTINELSNSPSKIVASDFVIDSTFSSIVLSDIAGVYDYKAIAQKKGGQSILKFFTKSAENALMLVRLPEEKVKNPRVLFQYSPSDTSLVNNYVIALSAYNYNFNRYLGWDYKMVSSINVKDIDAGNLKIQSSFSKLNGYNYASEFVYANGYITKCDYSTGDTAVATYSLSDGSKIIYEEKYTAIKSAVQKRHKEKEYSLTIGNVQIVRKQGKNALDSAKVYVGGVLQLSSKVEIVDVDSVLTDGTENSVMNHKRELKITFDDGTSSTISELLGSSVETIRTLFASLRQATFSTAIIDKIAWELYRTKE